MCHWARHSVIEKTLQIAVADNVSVTAVRTSPEAQPDWLFLYAPGAGSNLNDPFGAYASGELAARGIASARFQFPYMEAGKRRPDRPAVLEETWRKVIETLGSDAPKMVVGGRSMGGRIASQVVAKGVPADALALFAYPLRPPWNPSTLRDEHLPAIDAPTLFCSGTRDNFGSPEELRQAAAKVPRSNLHLLDGADHGFSVLKSSDRTRDEVWNEAVAALVDWLGTL